jgi:hypothetical protein
MHTPSNINTATETDHKTAEPTLVVIMVTTTARFPLGHVFATPGAVALLEDKNVSASALLNRHLHGDWGDVGAEDAAQNEFAVSRRLRLMSVYRLLDAERLAAMPESQRAAAPTVWVITEADRSSTTLLLPKEY